MFENFVQKKEKKRLLSLRKERFEKNYFFQTFLFFRTKTKKNLHFFSLKEGGMFEKLASKWVCE